MKEFDLISKIKDINKFVENYKKILSIKENIEIKKSSQPGDSSIICNCKKNKCTLLYYPNDHIFLLIHELGHLYFAMITKCIYFAKQPNSNTNGEIFRFVNSIVDAIVNYKISRFEEVYPYFVNYIEYVFYRTRTGINIKHRQLFYIVRLLCLFTLLLTVLFTFVPPQINFPFNIFHTNCYFSNNS